MSLLSAPGYQNNTYEVTTRGVVMHPDVFLSKQVLTTVAGRWRDAQTIEVPGTYTLLVLQETTPGAKRPPRMVSAFLGKYASIIAVDLIQGRN